MKSEMGFTSESWDYCFSERGNIGNGFVGTREMLERKSKQKITTTMWRDWFKMPESERESLGPLGLVPNSFKNFTESSEAMLLTRNIFNRSAWISGSEFF
jgi:hypothetical protein